MSVYIYIGCAKGEEFDQGLLGLISGGFYGCGLGLWAKALGLPGFVTWRFMGRYKWSYK